jgi:hypothetical protein
MYVIFRLQHSKDENVLKFLLPQTESNIRAFMELSKYKTGTNKTFILVETAEDKIRLARFVCTWDDDMKWILQELVAKM